MTVSDNTIIAVGSSAFFNNLGKKRLNVSKLMVKNVVNNPRRALDITANNATAAATRNLKNILPSLPELMISVTQAKGFTKGNSFLFMSFKWNKKQQRYTHLHQKKATT